MQHQNSEALTTCDSQGFVLPVNPCEKTNMNIVTKNELTFQNFTFNPVMENSGVWLTSTELAKVLGYKKTDAISQIYSRNFDEFTDSMTMTLNMRVNGINNSLRNKLVRVYSLRGAHLIAMFATTKVAKDFRKWVLDILDKEVDKKPEVSPLYRYKAKLILLDEETGDKFEILGKAMDLRTVAYGLASDLGYRPNAFTHVPVSPKKLRKIH
ncbi:BRO-N domain-containing protein [Yersinia mollaretii]|uniref:BRO-N domain-containing protein n=1 Tax=Yersinia mollaretii TaxID=33060 RepID=UPI0021BD0BA0